MTDQPSRSLLPRFSMVTCNVMFTMFLFGGIYLIGDNSFDPESLNNLVEATALAQPWLSFAILVPAILLIAFLLTLGSEIDRRCAEDYVYQIVSNAALVAVTTTLIGYLFWDQGSRLGFGLRPPVSDDFVGVLLLGWATGWFTIRARGLTA